ncbi:hypothetical protein I317_06227 [Kwoniella heveanensis CBS 569]|nr:hypothetical protein I317_06227 [Kwoniella heveanensis CBS 569]
MSSHIASSNVEPFSHIPRALRACLLLSPSFWSLNMGTGITSILVHNLPYRARWLEICGTILFVLNIIIFIALLIGNIVRYTRWKGVWSATIAHHVSGMYWGCLPMGLATIVNMVAFVCVPAWGRKFAYLALGLWWIDVILSIAVNIGMIFVMFTRQSQTHQSVSSTWLLPVVASVVASASGGIVSQALAPFNPSLARSTVICSLGIWGTGVPIAMMVIGIWIHRCAVRGLPAPAALPSVFLPLGPCGQGSYGLTLLGQVIRELAYTYDTHFALVSVSSGVQLSASGETSGTLNQASMLAIADAIYAGCLVIALILWGLGMVLYILAMMITIDHGLRSTSYWSPDNLSIGWLAYTFPIGVWATATTILSQTLDSPALKVIATMISLQVILSWMYIFWMLLYKMWHGTIFIVPELEMLDGEEPALRFGGHSKPRERDHNVSERDQSKSERLV